MPRSTLPKHDPVASLHARAFQPSESIDVRQKRRGSSGILHHRGNWTSLPNQVPEDLLCGRELSFTLFTIS